MAVTGPHIDVTYKSDGNAYRAYINLGGKELELPSYFNSTLTFPDVPATATTITYPQTTTSDVPLPGPTEYQKSIQELTKAAKKATGVFRKLAEVTEDQPPTVLVDIFNRIGDTVYGSTWHSYGAKIGDQVILEDKHTEVTMDGVVEFIEGESIGYRI